MTAPNRPVFPVFILLLFAFPFADTGKAALEIFIDSTSGEVVSRLSDLDPFVVYTFPGEILPRQREDDGTLVIRIQEDFTLATNEELRGAGKYPVKIVVGNDVHVEVDAIIDFSAIEQQAGAGGGSASAGGAGGAGGAPGRGGAAGRGGKQGSGGLIVTPSSPIPISITTPGLGAKSGTGGTNGTNGGSGQPGGEGRPGGRGMDGSSGMGADFGGVVVAKGGAPSSFSPSLVSAGGRGSGGSARSWPPRIFWGNADIRKAIYGEDDSELNDFRSRNYDGEDGVSGEDAEDQPEIDLESVPQALGKDGEGGKQVPGLWTLSGGGSGGGGSGGSGGPGGAGGGGGGGGAGGQGEWAEPIPTTAVDLSAAALDAGLQYIIESIVNSYLEKKGISGFITFAFPTIDYGATGGKGGRGGIGTDGGPGGVGGRGGAGGAGGGALQIEAQGRIIFEGEILVSGGDAESGSAGDTPFNPSLPIDLGLVNGVNGGASVRGFGMSNILNPFGLGASLLDPVAAGNGGDGGDGGKGGKGSDGYPGGSGGGGAGGTVILSAAAVEGSGNFVIKGGNSDDDEVDRRGQSGRVFLASNTIAEDSPIASALASEGFSVEGSNVASNTRPGPAAPNPFIAGRSPTPVIAGLPVGAEAYGFLAETAQTLTVNGSTLISKAPSGSEDPVICAYRADTLAPNATQFPEDFPEDYPGYDFVFIFNAGTDLLSDVRFGANGNFADTLGNPIPDPNLDPALGDIALALAPFHSASARTGGFANDPNFGGGGDVAVDTFSGFQVYVFLVPEDVPAVDANNPGKVWNFALTADSGGATFRIEVDKFENGDVLCASSNPDIEVFDAVWQEDSSTYWSDTTNWLISGWAPPMSVPRFPNNNATAAFNVLIQGGAEVNQDVTVTIDRLLIGAGSYLIINSGETLVLEKFDVRANAGQIDNTGVIELGDIEGADLTALLFSGTELMLNGPGILRTLADSGANYLIGGLRQSDSLINGVGHTIEADGNLGGNTLSITNLGMIRNPNGSNDDPPDGVLVIDPSGDASRSAPGFVNEGSVLCQFGEIRFSDGFFHNKPGGIIGFGPNFGLEQILSFDNARFLGDDETFLADEFGRFLSFSGDTWLEKTDLEVRDSGLIFIHDAQLNLGGGAVTHGGAESWFPGVGSVYLNEDFDYPIEIDNSFIRAGTFDFSPIPGLATCANPGGVQDLYEYAFVGGHSGLEEMTIAGNYCFDRMDEISAMVGGPFTPVVGFDHVTLRVSSQSFSLRGGITNDGLITFENDTFSLPAINDVPIRGIVNLEGSGLWKTGARDYRFVADDTTMVNLFEIGADQTLLDPIFFTSPLGNGESSLLVESAADMHGASFTYDDSVLESPVDKDAALAALKDPLILVNRGLIEPNGIFGGGSVSNDGGIINLGEVPGEYDTTFENVRIVGGELALHHFKTGGWATTILNSPVTKAFNADFESVQFRSPAFQPVSDLSSIPDISTALFGDFGLIVLDSEPLQRGLINCPATSIGFIDVSLATHLQCDDAYLAGSLTLDPGVAALFGDAELGGNLALHADSTNFLSFDGSLSLAAGAPVDTLFFLPAGLNVRANGEFGSNELYIYNQSTLDMGLDSRFGGTVGDLVINPAGDMDSSIPGFTNRGIIRAVPDPFRPSPLPELHLSDGFFDNVTGTFELSGNHRIENALLEGGTITPSDDGSVATINITASILKDLTIQNGIELGGNAILDNVALFNTSRFGDYFSAFGEFTIRGDLELGSTNEGSVTAFEFGAPPKVENPAIDRILANADAYIEISGPAKFESLVNDGYIEGYHDITITTPLRPTGQLLDLDTLVANPNAPIGTLTTLRNLQLSSDLDVEVAGLVRNSGTIYAGFNLLIDQAVVDNSGFLSAVSVIQVSDSLIRNVEGQIGSGGEDAIQFFNAIVQGGVIDGESYIEDLGTGDPAGFGTESITTFSDVTLSGSLYVSALLSCIGTVDFQNAGVENDGEILLSGSNSVLLFSGSSGNFYNRGTLTLNEGTVDVVTTTSMLFYTGDANSVIRGNGTLKGNYLSAGRISPGLSVGQLDFTDDLILEPTSVLAIEIGDDGADLITEAGTIATTFTGALEITTLEDSNVCGDDFFTVFTSNQPLTGDFSNSVVSGSRVPTTDGGSFQIFYGAGSPFDPNSLVLASYEANNGAFEMTPISGTLLVTQNDAGNAQTSVTIDFSAGSIGTTVDNVEVSNRGDYVLNFGTSDDVANGVMLTTVAEDGRSNGDTLGFFYSTTNGWPIRERYVAAVSPIPVGGEANANVAYAWFPFDDWLAAVTSNPSNGAAFSVLHASPGIDNTVIVDNGGGISTLDLQLVDPEATSQNGILLVNSAENEDNYTLSKANADGSFTIYQRDNGSDAGYEPDSISFAYVPKSAVDDTALIAMGRVRGDGTTEIKAGQFELTKSGTASWFLRIPGHDPDSGNLLLSPESEGSGPTIDKTYHYEWQPASRLWKIQSIDIPSIGPVGDAGTDRVFSFAFFTTRTPLVVTTSSDELDALSSDGDGISLREAIRDAAPGTTIIFDASLTCQPINLTMGELEITKNVTIDASGVPGGMTLSGMGTHRVFHLTSTGDLILDSLTLQNGLAGLKGGAVYSENAGGSRVGNLVLRKCSVLNSTAPLGGGVFVDANKLLFIEQSTFHGNTSNGFGGGALGVGNNCVVSISNSSFIENTSGNRAGAMYIINSPTVISHTTIAGNEADRSTGVYQTANSLTLSNCLIIDNVANGGIGPDLERPAGTTTTQGLNIISDLNASGLTAGLNVLVDSPALLPFGDYGGLTWTSPAAPDSSAIDAATVDPHYDTDQRGFPRDATPDVGAVEWQGSSDLVRIWDTDYDKDGTVFGVEQALGTNAFSADPAAAENLNVTRNLDGKPVLKYGFNQANASDTIWILKRSTNLVTFVEVFRYDGSSMIMTEGIGIDAVMAADEFIITDSFDPDATQVFYRFEAQPVTEDE